MRKFLIGAELIASLAALPANPSWSEVSLGPDESYERIEKLIPGWTKIIMSTETSFSRISLLRTSFNRRRP